MEMRSSWGGNEEKGKQNTLNFCFYLVPANKAIARIKNFTTSLLLREQKHCIEKGKRIITWQVYTIRAIRMVRLIDFVRAFEYVGAAEMHVARV